MGGEKVGSPRPGASLPGSTPGSREGTNAKALSDLEASGTGNQRGSEGQPGSTLISVPGARGTLMNRANVCHVSIYTKGKQGFKSANLTLKTLASNSQCPSSFNWFAAPLHLTALSSRLTLSSCSPAGGPFLLRTTPTPFAEQVQPGHHLLPCYTSCTSFYYTDHVCANRARSRCCKCRGSLEKEIRHGFLDMREAVFDLSHFVI